jgi:hypothetical protein
MMMNQEDPQPVAAPQQPVVPSININVQAPPADAAEAPAIEIDAAPVIETKKPGKKSSSKKSPASPPSSTDGEAAGSQKNFVEEVNEAADEARKAGEDLQRMGDQIRKDFGR